MKPSDLWTPKGRRAVGKLSLDLLKITGKVAVAGTASLAGGLASAAVATTPSEPESHDEDHFAELYSKLKDGERHGIEGYGYYSGGFRVDDD